MMPSCQCLPPPSPPIFDLPPPPDPSLVLHLLIVDEPLETVQKFQLSASCPALSLWARLERVGGDFALVALALLLLCFFLLTSGAAIGLRRRKRANCEGGEEEEEEEGGCTSRKRRQKSNSSARMAPPAGGCTLSCDSSSSGSPEHRVAAANFSRRSSTETMASAASPVEQQPHRGWLFQPNFFSPAPNVLTASFRPNTVGAPRRKLQLHQQSSFNHPHHHSCCSPAFLVPIPPRTVALRLPRHFSSSEGQFVAWRTENVAAAAVSSSNASYGYGGGSELYEELVGEDVAEAPYKRRMPPPPSSMASAPSKRMPPPSSRPPPPPSEQHHHQVATKNGTAGCGDGSPYGDASSADDLESGERQPRDNSAVTGQSRTESGYGTGGRGRRTGNGGIWRGAAEQQPRRGRRKSPKKSALDNSMIGGNGVVQKSRNAPEPVSGSIRPPVEYTSGEEGEYCISQEKAMTYV